MNKQSRCITLYLRPTWYVVYDPTLENPDIFNKPAPVTPAPCRSQIHELLQISNFTRAVPCTLFCTIKLKSLAQSSETLEIYFWFTGAGITLPRSTSRNKFQISTAQYNRALNFVRLFETLVEIINFQFTPAGKHLRARWTESFSGRYNRGIWRLPREERKNKI